MKHTRSLCTNSDLDRAHHRMRHDGELRKMVDAILQQADQWALRDDAWLENVITPASVPRAFNAHHMGCPIHGLEYFKHGNYSFRFSLDRPFKIICPVGGEEYPSNDFAAYLSSDMTDKSLLTGPYADDGWGWKKPGDDKKWWFVAYYNHWAWMNEIIPGILALSRAYLFTQDIRYAHKAGLLLHRVADVYPQMDHNKQSRWATEFAPTYQGRIVNCIWECGLSADLSEAYDNIFEGLAKTTTLQTYLKRSAADICAHIEKNLIDEIISGVYKGQIRGNYGMHQHALLTAARVRQGDVEKAAIDFLLSTVGNPLGYTYEGLDYLVANLLHRDGVSVTENAPGYAWIWVERTLQIAEQLKKLGVNLYQRHPKLREILLHPMRSTVLDKFTPAYGDSASVTEGHTCLPGWCAEIGWREYRDPRFINYLYDLKEQNTDHTHTYEDLFHDPIDLPPRPSRSHPDAYHEFDGAYNHGGLGLAMLRSGSQNNRRALALWYGTSIGHGHRDKLMVEVYAKGRKVLPDLGYPQFTDDHPERDAWTKNTISHTTVVVNAKMQHPPAKGDLHLFAALPGVQVVEASAESNYPGLVSQYHRTVGLIDISDTEAYAIDIFRVTGGHQHDYSLHGPDGVFNLTGLTLSDPAPGTLAGPHIPYAQLYDDPELSGPHARGFNRYRGSGFSYIKNPQHACAKTGWQATWQLDQTDSFSILHIPINEENLFVGDGIPPFKPQNPLTLKYLISRRTGENLSSTFVSLFIPHTGKNPIQSARQLAVSPAGSAIAIAIAIAIDRGEKTDIVISSRNPATIVQIEGGITYCGRFGILTCDKNGTPERASLFGGGQLLKGICQLTNPGDITGTVTALHPNQNAVEIATDHPETVPHDLSQLIHRELLVSVETDSVPHRTHRTSGLRIFHAEQKGQTLMLGFGSQDLQTAQLPIAATNPAENTLTTRAHLPLTEVGFYNGAYATDDSGRAFRIHTITPKGIIHLSKPANLDSISALKLFEIGPGDKICLPSVGTWTATDGS